MRILYVTASLAAVHGGPSKMCLEMAQTMAAMGHDVDIFTTDQDGTEGRLEVPLDQPVQNNGVNIYYFRADILKFWPAASFALARALKERIRDYDIVHSHSLYLFHGLAVAHYCRKYEVPYLVRPCGALDPVIFRKHRPRKAIFEYLFERRNLADAAAVHFTSQDELTNALRVFPLKNGVVVPLGLNLAEYDAHAEDRLFRKTYPEISDRRIVLFLGRIDFKKGLDLLIPAFADVVKKKSDVHLVLAGPDSDGYGSKVRQWISENGIEDRVLMTGMIQGDIKLAALHEAEFFVLPSYGENFGVAVAEAMACSLPVVVSDQVAIWKDVETNGAGVVVQCNVSNVASAMNALLDDKALVGKMGQAARSAAANLYSWPTIGKRLEEVYVSILGRVSHGMPSLPHGMTG